MNLIEIAIAMIAPHTCLKCKQEGSPLCENCAAFVLAPSLPACYRCARGLNVTMHCPACAPVTSLSRVWPGAAYGDLVKEAVALLKFSRAKAMAEALAGGLDIYLPRLPPATVVSHIPTAHSRIRSRGYDQAQLIAKAFARKRRLQYQHALRRTKTTRQVGSGRMERFRQLHDAFEPYRPARLAGRPLLLIDDVLTTGATLEAAARALRATDCGEIGGATIAHALAKK